MARCDTASTPRVAYWDEALDQWRIDPTGGAAVMAESLAWSTVGERWVVHCMRVDLTDAQVAALSATEYVLEVVPLPNLGPSPRAGPSRA